MTKTPRRIRSVGSATHNRVRTSRSCSIDPSGAVLLVDSLSDSFDFERFSLEMDLEVWELTEPVCRPVGVLWLREPSSLWVISELGSNHNASPPWLLDVACFRSSDLLGSLSMENSLTYRLHSARSECLFI
mmetsp:Transcript_27465/g.62263  ORF Transcript_27465/g.62263 Transcript_27465/m.62263 type:complete len:131 (+) Transcript_27465:581-973(+)